MAWPVASSRRRRRRRRGFRTRISTRVGADIVATISFGRTSDGGCRCSFSRRGVRVDHRSAMSSRDRGKRKRGIGRGAGRNSGSSSSSSSSTNGSSSSSRGSSSSSSSSSRSFRSHTGPVGPAMATAPHWASDGRCRGCCRSRRGVRVGHRSSRNSRDRRRRKGGTGTGRGTSRGSRCSSSRRSGASSCKSGSSARAAATPTPKAGGDGSGGSGGSGGVEARTLGLGDSVRSVIERVVLVVVSSRLHLNKHGSTGG